LSTAGNYGRFGSDGILGVFVLLVEFEVNELAHVEIAAISVSLFLAGDDRSVACRAVRPFHNASATRDYSAIAFEGDYFLGD